MFGISMNLSWDLLSPDQLAAVASAGLGQRHTPANLVFGESMPVPFAKSLNALRRTATNDHYRVVLSELGLGNEHCATARGRQEKAVSL